MRPTKLGVGKKHIYKKKKRTAPSEKIDQESGAEETSPVSTWVPLPPRGIGIILLSIIAGFSVASLILKPWSKMTNWSENQSSYRVAMEDGKYGKLGSTGSIGAPIGDLSNGSASLGFDEPTPAPTLPIPAVKVVKLLPASTRQPGNFNDPRILWIHLHSYGGTTMCDLARAHGEKVSPPKDNCNVMPDGCSTPKSFRIPCRKRAASLQYTFSAVERALDEDDLACSKASTQTMLFGIMLRDPVAGLKSTLIGNEFEKGLMMQALRGHVAPRNLAFHFCLPPFDTYQHFDNFAVRSLSGDYDVPPGEMTIQHLEKAKGVLSKLDVILIMEDLSEHLPQLRAVFGWDVDLNQNPWRSHWHRIPKNVFSPQEAAFFKEANALDYELYDFAQTLARQLTAQALQRLANPT